MDEKLESIFSKYFCTISAITRLVCEYVDLTEPQVGSNTSNALRTLNIRPNVHQRVIYISDGASDIRETGNFVIPESGPGTPYRRLGTMMGTWIDLQDGRVTSLAQRIAEGDCSMPTADITCMVICHTCFKSSTTLKVLQRLLKLINGCLQFMDYVLVMAVPGVVVGMSFNQRLGDQKASGADKIHGLSRGSARAEALDRTLQRFAKLEHPKYYPSDYSMEGVATWVDNLKHEWERDGFCLHNIVCCTAINDELDVPSWAESREKILFHAVISGSPIFFSPKLKWVRERTVIFSFDDANRDGHPRKVDLGDCHQLAVGKVYLHYPTSALCLPTAATSQIIRLEYGHKVATKLVDDVKNFAASNLQELTLRIGPLPVTEPVPILCGSSLPSLLKLRIKSWDCPSDHFPRIGLMVPFCSNVPRVELHHVSAQFSDEKDITAGSSSHSWPEVLYMSSIDCIARLPSSSGLRLRPRMLAMCAQNCVQLAKASGIFCEPDETSTVVDVSGPRAPSLH